MSSSELTHRSTALGWMDTASPAQHPRWGAGVGGEHSLPASAWGREKVQNAVNTGLPPSVQKVSNLLGRRAEPFPGAAAGPVEARGTQGCTAEQAPVTTGLIVGERAKWVAGWEPASPWSGFPNWKLSLAGLGTDFTPRGESQAQPECLFLISACRKKSEAAELSGLWRRGWQV